MRGTVELQRNRKELKLAGWVLSLKNRHEEAR